jgi:hypothetical protein
MNEIFDGFSVVLGRENDLWKAHFIEDPSICGVSPSYIEAIVRIKINWEKYKADARKKGKDIPLPAMKKKFAGSFNIRLDEDLHKSLVNEALHNNISLNALVQKKLRQSTISERKNHIWNLDRIVKEAKDLSIYLFFSYDEKGTERAILKLYQTNLADTLGDDSIFSEENLEKSILKPEINQAIQQFLQAEHYSGVITKQELIECFLISTEEMRRVRHYLNRTQDLEETFPKKGDFYLVKIVR